MLNSETMIDKEDYDIINNDFGHSDPFQSGIFGGLSEVVELEKVVDDTLVTTGAFYKQALSLSFSRIDE